MDFRALLPNDIVKQLKCASCKNFLSHFPVYSCDNQNICGRCVQPEETPYFRNNLYEQIARHLKFPCRYKNEGCDEEIFPSDIPQHERTCPYRRIKCPMADTCHCDWEASRPFLLQHCRDNHMDSFIKCNGFEIDVTQSNEKTYLVENNDQLLYVETKFDLNSKYFECAFYHLEDETNNVQYPYQLALKNGARCISVQTITSTFIEKQFSDISLELLKSCIENFPSQVVGCITFGEIGIDSSLATLDNLKDLKCFDCSESTKPPLYQCFLKHLVFCKKCLKKHLPSCITCTQLLHVVHNAESLECEKYDDEITNLLDHSCKYKEKGCSVMVRGYEMDQHEEYCPFTEVKCPVNKCSWNGSLQKLVSHIKQDHYDRKIQCNVEKRITVSYKEQNYHGSYQVFIEYLDTFFNVKYERSNNQLDWIVQTIDKCHENYYYQIEILNGQSGNNTRKFKMGAPCSSLIRLYGNNKYICRMHLDQIGELANKKLIFKINIFKRREEYLEQV